MHSFHERGHAPGWMVILGSVIALGSALVLALSIPSLGQREISDAGVLVTALSIGIGIGIAAATQCLSLRVRDRTLTITLTPFYRRKIDGSQVALIEQDTVHGAGHGGTGVRRAPGRPPAVFQRGGSAARLELLDGSTLLVECRDVDGLRSALQGPTAHHD